MSDPAATGGGNGRLDLDSLTAPTGRSWRLATLLVLAMLTFAVPFMGLQVSLCLPILMTVWRRDLWSGVSLRRSMLCGVLGWIGLWWPGVVSILFGYWIGPMSDLSTSWLILPLCGPVGTGTWLIPALAATIVSGAGIVVAVAKRQPWYWVLGAWAAPWVHHLAFSLLPNHEFIC